LHFTVENLEQYNQKINMNEGADWRIKEALMFAIGTIRDEIESQKDLKKQMEQMLMSYVLPELTSDQPFMRLRACWTYGVCGDFKFKDNTHVQRICDGIFKNMAEDQPLPLRFQAACALEKILRLDAAIDFIRPGIDVMLKCYLSLMNEFDNEELVSAFENIMQIFQDEIRPYAMDICNHLRHMYQRCIQQDQNG
jgi:importin-7